MSLGKDDNSTVCAVRLPLTTDALPSSASRGQHQIIQRVTGIQRKGVLSFAVSDIDITLTFKYYCLAQVGTKSIMCLN